MRRSILALLFPFFLCQLGGSPVGAVDVLLLGDSEAEDSVSLELLAAGHTVTFGGTFHEWNGTTPSAFDHQVVVLLSGEQYFNDLEPAALVALQKFVAAGCGLVTTEWSAYAVAQGLRSPLFGELLPVFSPSGTFGTGATWEVRVPGHPLVAGLPDSFGVEGGWSDLFIVEGTTSVIQDEIRGGNPMVSYSNLRGGTTVHINHDLTYELATIPDNILRLITNAARYAACLPFADGFESGTTDAWSVFQ